MHSLIDKFNVFPAHDEVAIELYSSFFPYVIIAELSFQQTIVQILCFFSRGYYLFVLLLLHYFSNCSNIYLIDLKKIFLLFPWSFFRRCLYDRMVIYASQYYIHRLMIHKVANYHAKDGIQHKMCVQFYCPWFHYWTSQTHIRLPMLMLQWCTADGVILTARIMNIQISSGEIYILLNIR